MPQETCLPQAVHKHREYNTEAFKTTQLELASQNDSSVGYSDRKFPSAVYWLEALHSNVQPLGPKATTSVESIDQISVDSNQITPQADDTLQRSESQSRNRHIVSSTNLNVAISHRGSSHQRDDQCKSKEICTICRGSFTLRASLKRHKEEQHQHEGEYWCPPIGLVTKRNGNGVCAVCGHNDPDADHFMTTHKFKECYQATKFGTRKRFKRKDRFITHLKDHDIYEGSLCHNRDIRYVKNKGTYGCGYCPTVFLDWTGFQEHLTHHLRNSLTFPWDHSMVIEVLLSQDFVRGPWQKLLCTLFSGGQPQQRLTWPEMETSDLQSSLERRQAPARAEKLALDAFNLTLQRPWLCSTRELALCNPFGYLDAASVLSRQEDYNFLGPVMLPRQNQTENALNNLGLQTNAFCTNNVSSATRIGDDHTLEPPFGNHQGGNDEIEWSYN
ncbi:hypothetical protein MMC15_002299 [Xylographa vitiligo]|nr:hypothetical protein [Xylographa vitiligo]